LTSLGYDHQPIHINNGRTKRKNKSQIVPYGYAHPLPANTVQNHISDVQYLVIFQLSDTKEKYFGYAINPIYQRFLPKAISYFVAYLELTHSLRKFMLPYTVNM